LSVPGFADMHNHQFAHLGFGGLEFFGAPSGPVDQALPWCTPVHGLGGTTDVIGSFMKWSTYGFHFNFGHKVGGYPAFDGWPRWDSYTHQTVHVDWLQRAWQGGMRLMVMLAVNNEWMCKLPGFKLAPGRTPADMEAVDLQLDAAVALEAQLDQQAGGPGQGWYRIVRSAEEAASVIEAGKLAVLLGIEVDYLFGSYIPDPLGNPTPNLLTPDQVKASVQQYYDKGVRYVFPIHFADNAFGGTGLQNSMEAADTGVDFNTPIGDLHTPYILETVDGTNLGYTYSGLNTQGRVGRRNKRGLTGLGKVLIQELIAHQMLFDVDHMSWQTRSDVLDIAEAANYPVISGHSGFIDVCLGDKRHEGQQTGAEVDRIRGTGGMIAPIIAQGNLAEIKTWTRPDGTSIRHVCGSTANSYLQAYLYAVERMNGGPVGIGTDFNGFAGVPGPITGPDACPGKTAPNTPPPAQLSYPLTAAVTGAQMQRSQIGQKTFDINTDGLAHVGMLPDFIAHLSAMGVRDDELQPLLRSADGFVQTWKRTSPATPRIAVLSMSGSLSVKEGDLDAAWVQETGGPGRLGPRMGRRIRQMTASDGVPCPSLTTDISAKPQVKDRSTLDKRSAPSRIRTCAHGSGVRSHLNLGPVLTCQFGFSRGGIGVRAETGALL
jgi:microsomal dipeptidase-like Zn-dependent dipeptidase